MKGFSYRPATPDRLYSQTRFIEASRRGHRDSGIGPQKGGSRLNRPEASRLESVLDELLCEDTQGVFSV